MGGVPENRSVLNEDRRAPLDSVGRDHVCQTDRPTPGILLQALGDLLVRLCHLLPIADDRPRQRDAEGLHLADRTKPG